MVLVALAGRSTANIVIALAFVYTPIYIRLTRAEVLNQKNRGFIEAARALGNRELTIALRHVLPNSLAPALIQSSVTIGFAILLTAGLSFVGAGVRPPTPEWGLMIASGANEIILGEWWSSVFPGIAISITVFGFAVLGDALERRNEA
jgi:peptide/nickel transport system permease protein